MRMLLGLVLFAALMPEVSRDNAERVYAVQLPTWFENAWDRATISPDGHWALWGAPGQIQIIDLTTRSAVPGKLSSGLERVMNAAFLPNGELARYGELHGKKGWFVPVGNELHLSDLPEDAVPQWATDGTLAFYLSQKPEDGIFVGTSTTPKRYALNGSVTGFAFSPSGNAIYVLLWQPDGSSSLVRVTTKTGRVEIIASKIDACPFFNSIGVAPDDSHLYLALATNGAPQNRDRHEPDAKRDLNIYEFDLVKNDRLVRVQTPTDDFAPVVANSQLYWTRNDFQDSVVLVPFGGGDAQVLVQNGELPRWTPDGKHIAYIYGGQGWPWRLADFALSIDVAIIDVDASGRPASKSIPFIKGTGEDFPPAWSPDRRWMVFHSHRSEQAVPSYGSKGQSDDIYLRRTSGTGKEIRLTNFGWEAGVATWSPDGRRIVFCTWDRAKSSAYKPWEGGGTPVGYSQPWIITIDPLSGKTIRKERLKLPTDVPGADEAVWSPTEDEIAVEDRVGPSLWAIWIVSPDGKKERKVVEYSSTTYGGLDWSRDGKTIVYGGMADGKMQLFSIPAVGGGEPHQLTHDSANLLHPNVSPDGRWIACTKLLQTKEVKRISLK